MINKTFISVNTFSELEFEAFGIQYKISVENYENTNGYARCLIWDKTHDERYHSEGFIEINNHFITTKWKAEYDYNRDNWICSKDLEISIV